MSGVIHYADEDRGLAPLCGGGVEGDLMRPFAVFSHGMGGDTYHLRRECSYTPKDKS